MKKVFPTLSEEVRIKALEAFYTNNFTQARWNWFVDLTKSTDNSIELTGRLFVLRSEADQNKLAEKLKDVFVDFDRLDSDASQMRFLEKIDAFYGKVPVVQTWMLSLVNGNRPSHMKAVAIAKLSAVKASGLDSNIGTLAHHAEPEVRAAAIEAIPSVCPKKLWSILDEAAKTEPSTLVLERVLSDLSSLKGKEALNTLKVVESRDGKLPKEVLSRLPEVKRDLASAPQTNKCAQQ